MTRPVLLSDVCFAARALLAVPQAKRYALCKQLLREAHWADCFTRRLGKPHPEWGNGTLKAAALGHVLADEPTFADLDYCRAFEIVLAQLGSRFHHANL